MITKELQDFIKKQKEMGMPIDAIKRQLSSGGWTEEDIEEGFQSLNQVQIPVPPVAKKENKDDVSELDLAILNQNINQNIGVISNKDGNLSDFQSRLVIMNNISDQSEESKNSPILEQNKKVETLPTSSTFQNSSIASSPSESNFPQNPPSSISLQNSTFNISPKENPAPFIPLQPEPQIKPLESNVPNVSPKDVPPSFNSIEKPLSDTSPASVQNLSYANPSGGPSFGPGMISFEDKKMPSDSTNFNPPGFNPTFLNLNKDFPSNTQTQNISSNVSPKKSHILRNVFLSIFFLVLLLASGVVYGYFSGVILPPEETAQETFNNFKEAESFSYNTEITFDLINFKDEIDELISVLPNINSSLSLYGFFVTSEGFVNKKDLKNISLDNKFGLTMGEFSFRTHLKLTDKKMYFKIDEMPKLDSFVVLSEENLKQYYSILNKWFFVNLSEEDQEETNDIFSELFSPNNVLPGGNQLSYFEKDLSEEQKNELLKITENAKFIKITKRMIPERINGVYAHHILFELDFEGVKNYIYELFDFIQKNNLYGDKNLERADLEKVFSYYKDSIKKFQGEAWIGISDRYLHKIILDIELAPLASFPEYKDKTAKIKIVSTFSDWEKDLKVEVPTGGVDFEEYFKEQVGEMEEVESNPEYSKLVSLSAYRVYAEMFYEQKNSYLGFCDSEFLLKKDPTTELKNFDDITCKDGAEAFVAYFYEDDRLYCADSQGFLNEIFIEPKGLICK